MSTFPQWSLSSRTATIIVPQSQVLVQKHIRPIEAPPHGLTHCLRGFQRVRERTGHWQGTKQVWRSRYHHHDHSERAISQRNAWPILVHLNARPVGAKVHSAGSEHVPRAACRTGSGCCIPLPTFFSVPVCSITSNTSSREIPRSFEASRSLTEADDDLAGPAAATTAATASEPWEETLLAHLAWNLHELFT